MTEKRKRYLEGISSEERVIRHYILMYKKKIKMFKRYMNEDKEDIDYTRDACEEIAKRKIIIKALKKQLPAPTKSLINWHCNCPKCGFFVDGEEDNYCYNCGQKLR